MVEANGCIEINKAIMDEYLIDQVSLNSDLLVSRVFMGAV